MKGVIKFLSGPGPLCLGLVPEDQHEARADVKCIDHMIVLNEASLYRHVKSFLAYYHESRTHLSLAKDAPEPRPVHSPERGAVVAIPQVGGLHHRYERRAA